MPRSARPRKKYRKPAHDTRIFTVLPATIKVAELERNKRALPRVHLDALVRGGQNDEHFSASWSWRVVKGRVLWAVGMLTLFMADEPAARDVLERASKALDEARGQPTLNPDAVVAISEALNLADDLQEALTRREAAEALHWVRKTHPAIDVSMLIV